ncbi:MAG: PepSY-like domain-containing protein [Muribaculaceae bacterium]|nr:PepSY-like domain-containing protein [Muribaculaceae bacterium]
MKKILISLLVAVSSVSSALAFPIDKYTISREELPEAARQMLDEYFPKAKIGMIKIDKHLLKKTDYDVRLVNGTTIEFNNKGKWTSVNCKKNEVPEGLVMKTIRNHVAKNYNGAKIVSIYKKATHYEIGLSDDILLKYDLLGIFKGVKMEDTNN